MSLVNFLLPQSPEQHVKIRLRDISHQKNQECWILKVFVDFISESYFILFFHIFLLFNCLENLVLLKIKNDFVITVKLS